MIDACADISNTLLTVDQALEQLKLAIQPLEAYETIALPQALGRVLAQPVYASINIPFDRNSAMDGYALASNAMTPGQTFSLTCIGTSWAGRPFHTKLQPEQCLRIFTGAVVPEGADSVVMQEDVLVQGDTIHFSTQCQPYQNIRERGEDVTPGDCLLAAGKKLNVTDISLLAAAGIAQISVYRQIRIAFFSTGDELLALGEPLTSGKIYDSNRYTLQGLLTDACYVTTDMGVIPDDATLIENQLLAAAQNHDVIITTGGASVGDADYIKEVLARCGKVNFWKIAMKPGKPLAFGSIGSSYFFGLPGNPVSVMATFQQIVTPALQQLSGAMASKALTLSAICTSPLKKAPGRQEYQRGILSQDAQGHFFVSSSGGQGSNRLASLSRANCYIILPRACAGIKAGETVTVQPFSLQLPV